MINKVKCEALYSLFTDKETFSIRNGIRNHKQVLQCQCGIISEGLYLPAWESKRCSVPPKISALSFSGMKVQWVRNASNACW